MRKRAFFLLGFFGRRETAGSLEPGAWSASHGDGDVRYQTVRRQTLAVSLVQTNWSLRNEVTRGDCECHAKLATIYKMRPEAATCLPSSGGELPVDGRQCPEGADDGSSM